MSPTSAHHRLGPWLLVSAAALCGCPTPSSSPDAGPSPATLIHAADDSGVTLWIPEQSAPLPPITVTVGSSADGGQVVYLSPEGQVFSPPAWLTVPAVAGAGGVDVGPALLESGSGLEAVPTGLYSRAFGLPSGTHLVMVPHFSSVQLAGWATAVLGDSENGSETIVKMDGESFEVHLKVTSMGNLDGGSPGFPPTVDAASQVTGPVQLIREVRSNARPFGEYQVLDERRYELKCAGAGAGILSVDLESDFSAFRQWMVGVDLASQARLRQPIACRRRPPPPPPYTPVFAPYVPLSLVDELQRERDAEAAVWSGLATTLMRENYGGTPPPPEPGSHPELDTRHYFLANEVTLGCRHCALDQPQNATHQAHIPTYQAYSRRYGGLVVKGDRCLWVGPKGQGRAGYPAGNDPQSIEQRTTFTLPGDSSIGPLGRGPLEEFSYLCACPGTYLLKLAYRDGQRSGWVELPVNVQQQWPVEIVCGGSPGDALMLSDNVRVTRSGAAWVAQAPGVTANAIAADANVVSHTTALTPHSHLVTGVTTYTSSNAGPPSLQFISSRQTATATFNATAGRYAFTGLQAGAAFDPVSDSLSVTGTPQGAAGPVTEVLPAPVRQPDVNALFGAAAGLRTEAKAPDGSFDELYVFVDLADANNASAAYTRKVPAAELALRGGDRVGPLLDEVSIAMLEAGGLRVRGVYVAFFRSRNNTSFFPGLRPIPIQAGRMYQFAAADLGL